MSERSDDGYGPSGHGSKKGAQLRATIVFWDETGISDRPTVTRTWARRGRTPIIRSAGHWTVRTAVGIIARSPTGRRLRLLLRLLPGTFKSPDAIRTIRMLRRHIRGRIILIWDGLSSHQSRETRMFLATQERWLTVERFPSYAPELDPVEYLWSALKRGGLGNLDPDEFPRLRRHLQRSTGRLRRRPEILRGFLVASGLYRR